jgi:hypothetical protein
MLWYNCYDNIVFILFMFKIAMFIVYFDYILSIVSLSLCLCISSYNIYPNVHRVGGRDHVSMVLIWYLPGNTLYEPQPSDQTDLKQWLRCVVEVS